MAEHPQHEDGEAEAGDDEGDHLHSPQRPVTPQIIKPMEVNMPIVMPAATSNQQYCSIIPSIKNPASGQMT